MKYTIISSNSLILNGFFSCSLQFPQSLLINFCHGNYSRYSTAYRILNAALAYFFGITFFVRILSSKKRMSHKFWSSSCFTCSLFSGIPEAKLLNASVLLVLPFFFKILFKDTYCVSHFIYMQFCFKEATDL